MHITVKDRLIREATAIEEFRNLHPEEQKWLLPLLSRGIRSTTEMLILICENSMTFEEIASQLGIGAQTVSQKRKFTRVGRGLTYRSAELTHEPRLKMSTPCIQKSSLVSLVT